MDESQNLLALAEEQNTPAGSALMNQRANSTPMRGSKSQDNGCSRTANTQCCDTAIASRFTRHAETRKQNPDPRLESTGNKLSYRQHGRLQTIPTGYKLYFPMLLLLLRLWPDDKQSRRDAAQNTARAGPAVPRSRLLRISATL